MATKPARIDTERNYVTVTLCTELPLALTDPHRESKKTRHQTLGHNFTNYYPIFNFFH